MPGRVVFWTWAGWADMAWRMLCGMVETLVTDGRLTDRVGMAGACIPTLVVDAF